jgi:diguanylate cyclase (GGDEF)-like protein
MTSDGPRRANSSPGVDRRARHRRVGVVLGVLTALALAGGIAEYLAPAGERQWLADAGWTCGALIAVIGVASATFRSARRDRAGWTMLLAACLSYLVAQVFWDIGGLTSIPAQACWLGFAVMGAAGIHRLGLGAWGSRLVSWLEIAPLIAAVCALMTGLLWVDVQASSAPDIALITAFAAPVLYGAAVLVMLQSVLCGALDVRRNPGIAAVMAGVFLEAVAFVLWSPNLLAQTYTVGTGAADALWSVGLLFVGFGAWAARPPVAIADASTVSRRRGGALPALSFVTLLGTQAVFVAAEKPAGPTLALIAGALVVGTTGFARLMVLRREQAGLLAQLRERERELEDANDRLSAESRRDSLTGLGNRLLLREHFAELAARAGRRGDGYSIVLLDLDAFKPYNDILGHQAGDEALRQVAARLQEHARAEDRLYRYGGEEMLLVLPEQDLEAGHAVAERHRANIERAALPHPRNPPAGVVTFSGGVAAAQTGETPGQVLRRADKALYEAKAHGRNQIAAADPEPLSSTASRRADV